MKTFSGEHGPRDVLLNVAEGDVINILHKEDTTPSINGYMCSVCLPVCLSKWVMKDE